MKIHALTPSCRPQNLKAVGEALRLAQENAPGVSVHWHLIPDERRQYVAGYKLRNDMIERIEDGWLWCLDDDTLPHPHVLRRVHEEADGYDAVVFAYQQPDGWHEGCADPDRIVSGGGTPKPGDCVFDVCQVIWTRKLMGNYRFREDRAADGHLWEDVIRPANVRYLDEILAVYNSLRPGEWG